MEGRYRFPAHMICPSLALLLQYTKLLLSLAFSRIMTTRMGTRMVIDVTPFAYWVAQIRNLQAV